MANIVKKKKSQRDKNCQKHGGINTGQKNMVKNG